ncbi:MAG: 2-oxo acid dehydrogenase subunit E2 [Clostridia bacterium]|nr:2-oxo acid dehydrogenase subunit E2 [Clostridia bacterium]
MATPIIMPKQGQSVESCIIAKWHKQKGDSVNVGDMLFTYETDKATFDEEAEVAGTLIDVFFEEGDDVPCLTNVCVIGNEGEDTSAFKPASEDDDEPAAAAAAEEAPKAEAAKPAATVNTSGDTKASPRARALADSKGIDVTAATPTGPYGRIIERDVRDVIDGGLGASRGAGAGIAGTGIGGKVRAEDLANAPAAASVEAPAAMPEIEEVPITNIRKVIARSMHASLSEMAQLTLNTTFDATEIMAYRAKVKAAGEKLGLENITLNDIVLYVVSRVLLNHKDLNANFTGDTMKYFSKVNLGLAVDTPRGLMVPTIFAASDKSLNEISAEAKKLAAAAQGGTINPDLLQGASFTVTNLGSMGVESFTPVINPPQTGILGVDTLTTGIREVNGEIKTYKKMGLSLTFDHRAVDGAPAARMLRDVAFGLENFSLMLSK